MDSEENIQVNDYSLEGFQDPERWKIITQSYGLDEAMIRSIPLCGFMIGLDEAVMRSIPLCRFTKVEKLIDNMECAVCWVEFQENEALRLLLRNAHGSWELA